MAVLLEGLVTTLVVILLQSLVHTADGGSLSEEYHSLSNNNENLDENNIASDHLDPKFFQNMVDTSHELTAVESHQKSSKYLPQSREVDEQRDMTLINGEPVLPSPYSILGKTLLGAQDAVAIENHKKSFVLVEAPSWKPTPTTKAHHRQKRFITPYKLRLIAVPLSVFNFLGFLPVRVPGLPYHNDLPPPDYTYYNTMHDFHHPRRYKHF